MSLLYIIDGYNIIKHPQFSRADTHTDIPQEDLLRFIKAERLTGSHRNKTVVVFDGYPAQGHREGNGEGIEAVFSRRINADEKIRMLIEEYANRKNIIVVSDDRELKFSVKALGAQAIGVEEFLFAKKKRESKQREQLKPELNYTQMHKINEELRKIWLK